MTPSGFGSTALLLMVATMAAALAQAQQPSQASKATAPAVTSSSAAASQPARKPADTKSSARPVKTAAAQNAADSSPQLVRDARNAGFKPETIRGNLMFCRTAIELGSSFPVRTCYDKDQVKIKIHEYQTERNELEQQHNLGMFTH